MSQFSQYNDGVPVSAASAKKHSLVLEGRRNLIINGSEDIVSFDETNVVLQTAMGLLTIDGEQLRILKLTTHENGSDGSVSIEGKIGGIFYTDDNDGTHSEKKSGGLFGLGKKK